MLRILALVTSLFLAAPAQAQLRVNTGAGVKAVPANAGGIGQLDQQGMELSPASYGMGSVGQSSLSPALTQVPSLEVRTSINVPEAKASGMLQAQAVDAPVVRSAGAGPASLEAAVSKGRDLRPAPARRAAVSALKAAQVSRSENAKKAARAGRVRTAFSWGRSFFDGTRSGSDSEETAPVGGEDGVLRGPRLSRAERGQAKLERRAAVEKKMLEAGFPEPFKLPLWKRALAVTGIFGGLAAAPALLSAEVLPTVYSAVVPAIGGGAPLQIFAANAGLMFNPLAWAAAAAIAYATTPLRFFVYRMLPWSMRFKEDAGEKLFKQSPWSIIGKLALGAAAEEWLFRGVVFSLGFIFASAVMPAPLAFIAASFGGSFLFSIIHGYGPVWTRVVGGMLYCALFALTGSLLFAAVTHFFFNIGQYLAYLREARKQ